MVVVRLIKKITEKSSFVKFSELNAGETFKHEGLYYMKLDVISDDGLSRRVCLFDGSVDTLRPDETVIIVDMEVEVRA